MKVLTALVGGLAGASILTLIHESVRQFIPKAPRMDLMGKQALTKIIERAGKTPPDEKELYALTLSGDVASNALYYSLAGIGAKDGVLERGSLLGLAAGIGAVVLPKPLGLDDAPSSRTTETKFMTILLCTIGGLAAAAAMKIIETYKGD